MFEKIKKALASYYVLPIAMFFALLCWTFGINTLCLCTLAVLIGVILFFADDVKNIFPIIFFASLYIKDIILAETDWVLYIVCIGFACVSIFYRVGEILIKKKFVRGRLFYPLIIFDIAFLLGGIIGNFNFIAFLATFGLSLAILCLYVLATSATENFLPFFPIAFIVGAIYCTIQYVMFNGLLGEGIFRLVCGEEWKESGVWANSAGPNTSALYIGLGAISFLVIGHKKKYDYLTILGCFFCVFGILLTNCRGMMLYITVVAAPFIIYSFIKSPDKLKFGLAFGVSVGIVAFIVLCLDDTSMSIIDRLREKMSHGSNGRLELWPWCMEKFKKYPVFGYGFISPEAIPTLREQGTHYLMAHNTLLQWITSTGIVGTVLSVWYYVEKYTVCLYGFNKKHFGYVALILLIALSGLTEQAATMDPFVFMLPILIVSALEKAVKAKGKGSEQAKP